jgi:hypothetical protein
MANDIDFIGRDLGTPFNPEDTLEQRDCDDWTVPPTSGQLAEDLQGLTPMSRAVRMLDPALVAGLPLIDATNENEALDLDLPTPDEVTPDRSFERRGIHDSIDLPLNVPGLGPVNMWSFRDNVDGTSSWPAKTIRVKEGEVIHSRMANRRGPHTIHHHGIEPTPMNDGVGHLTMDIGGGLRYKYQWLAGESGTYFYHCHVNTVLHFEMGMYGMLIIDPDVPGAPFTDGGSGAVMMRDEPVSYDVEAVWVPDDIDRRWHILDQPNYHERAGIVRGEFVSINNPVNPRLHDFNPDVFAVSGVAAPFGQDGALLSGAQATATLGDKVLVRALNAAYCTTRWRFPATVQGTVVAVDGRTLGRSPFGRYSEPYSLASINHQFELTTAQRWDILIDTGSASRLGQHVVEVDFLHWYTKNRLFTVRMPIQVNSAGA